MKNEENGDGIARDEQTQEHGTAAHPPRVILDISHLQNTIHTQTEINFYCTELLILIEKYLCFRLARACLILCDLAEHSHALIIKHKLLDLAN